jgi:leucyl aminopeptidase
MPEALTPVALADETAKVAKNYGIDCSIYDEQFLAENKMGGVFGGQPRKR